METKNDSGVYGTALKVGVACGICAAVIELYYIVLYFANSSISEPMYQTLWLLTAFLFAMAGIWTIHRTSGVKTLVDIALQAGIAGLVTGIIYAIAVIVVQLLGNLYNIGYYSVASIIGTVFGVIFSSVMWLPVVVAVAVVGGVIYATLTQKI